jgi:hypothetical protein
MADHYAEQVSRLSDWVNETPVRLEIWNKLYGPHTVQQYCDLHAYRPRIIGDIVRAVSMNEILLIIKGIYG